MTKGILQKLIREMEKLIKVAEGQVEADLVIRNAKIIDVYNHRIVEGNIAVVDGTIAGVGDNYSGKVVVDAKGSYACPGFMDSHIHVESSYLSPEKLGELVVPMGTTTLIADPHEIVNVAGLIGLDYMIEAAKGTDLDIRYMMPSCVPATEFENSGAIVEADDMDMNRRDIQGLGEFMNFPGVTSCNRSVLEKIAAAKKAGKIIDGHAPGLTGQQLDAYVACGIATDHECQTPEEMIEKMSKGMYIQLRQGSSCHDLEKLAPSVTAYNSRRCLLCSDDLQPKTILEKGHFQNHLKIAVKNGVDPITAIQMASLNGAECYGLSDRGAISPGKRADIVLLKDLKDFVAEKVFIQGREVADHGIYRGKMKRTSIQWVRGRFNLPKVTEKNIEVKPQNPEKAITIGLVPGGVVTEKRTASVKIDEKGRFIYDKEQDICKIVVAERHKGTGNVAAGLLQGYGIQRGAIAVSIAHDSHNIIAAGSNDTDILRAIEALKDQEGGVVVVNHGNVVKSLPMPIAGIMSDKDPEYVKNRLTEIHDYAYDVLRINPEVDPVMTLTFMSLPVIPEIKITDMGVFDVNRFEIINV